MVNEFQRVKVVELLTGRCLIFKEIEKMVEWEEWKPDALSMKTDLTSYS